MSSAVENNIVRPDLPGSAAGEVPMAMHESFCGEAVHAELETEILWTKLSQSRELPGRGISTVLPCYC
jgi:hypothetical protein